MQFVDPKTQYKALKTGIGANSQSIMDSAQLIGGDYVKEPEEKLSAFVGMKSLVLRDVRANTEVAGFPAREFLPQKKV